MGRRPGTSPGTRQLVAEREPWKTALAPPAVKARLRPTTTLGNPTVAHIPAGRTHLWRPRRCWGHSGAGIRGLRQPRQITAARRHRQHASRGARGPGPDHAHSVASAHSAAPAGITTGRGANHRASARAGDPAKLKPQRPLRCHGPSWCSTTPARRSGTSQADRGRPPLPPTLGLLRPRRHQRRNRNNNRSRNTAGRRPPPAMKPADAPITTTSNPTPITVNQRHPGTRDLDSRPHI
jgi:hypothetical protein